MSPCTERTAPGSRLLWLTCIGVLFATPLLAQVPSLPPPGQAAQVLQQAVSANPSLANLITAKLQSSGMTPDQIRARLSAAGYSPSLLDSYMPGQPANQALNPGSQELGAIQALGLPPLVVSAGTLAVDTGIIARAARMAAESLATGRYVFGVDVFSRTATLFMPLLSGPVPPDYQVGPGDELVLILTGEVELSYDMPVTREGFIVVPQVGQIYVANQTLDQLRDVLYSRLGKVYSGVRRGAGARTQFTLSVANVRANQVYVVGEVNQPGAYQISALGTVLSALYVASGVTANANLRMINVQRGGKTVATFDLYDYLLKGDSRNDIRLQTGDVVFVGVHGTRAQVTGGVIRPAIYELKDGETLADLLKDAGGFKANAARKRLAIYRILPYPKTLPGPLYRTTIDVPLQVGADSTMKVPALALATGDSVVVDTIGSLEHSLFVGIAGMVRKPGAYAWHPGMTLRDLVLLARGPSVGADLSEAEIARLPAQRTQGELATTVRVPLDSTYLYERDSAGHYIGAPGLTFPKPGAAEVSLEPYDNVLIFRQPDFELQRTVTIVGEVKFPGTYSLKSKTDHLAALVVRAGGLTPQAYPDGIRFVRDANGVGRINVDLPDALRDTSSRANIILQPDDSIFIPEFEPTVKVNGAVNAPGSVLWAQGQSLSDYISAAGGFSYTADEGRVSVRYANGEVKTRHHFLFFHSNPKPGPGSEVTIPTKDLSHPTDYVALFGAIAQVLASSLAIVLLATKL
ncbi:MAG TPA: SLBB domain-containing protein [Gemmatimonadales bacterium]|nr:SLBB domain-containing protein [Gemmatimonadales bacterium]